MQKCVLSFFGLVLLLAAMVPAIEPMDKWDHTPGVAADTEFHVVAVALGVGLAALVLLISHVALRGFDLFRLLEPRLALLGVRLGIGVETVRVNGPPISSPLRI